MNRRWFLAYSFLLVAIHEAHELAHAITAKALCGQWPTRDFNAWSLAAPCSTWWPTAAGPLFSYVVMFAGVALGKWSRWAGVALLFAANPFARLFSVTMGSGDEMVVAQRLAGLSERTPLLRAIVFLFVLAICGSAIFVGWRQMKGLTHRAMWFAAVLLWPMVLTGVALFAIGNKALRAGVLTTPLVGGAPLLVVLVSGAATLLSLFTIRWLGGSEHEDRAFAFR
jgi:hypothetical protein